MAARLPPGRARGPHREARRLHGARRFRDSRPSGKNLRTRVGLWVTPSGSHAPSRNDPRPEEAIMARNVAERYAEMSVDDLRQEAKKAGFSRVWEMRKPELIDALARASGRAGAHETSGPDP